MYVVYHSPLWRHNTSDLFFFQGSHVVSESGSYILQWKYFDSAKTSFDFTLAPHKSKVMYHTELLRSEAFR